MISIKAAVARAVLAVRGSNEHAAFVLDWPG